MAEWKAGQVILGEYVIERELGRGGMGRVWLVKSNSTGRRFAVKQTLIKDDTHRKAFLTELQTWIDLPEHPNIVPCRFFRTVGDEIVIFADYLEGGSLADWIIKRKVTSLEQILDVAIQFAWGLHAIHGRGLIHQDIKPSNVLMTTDGIPMVTDFGLARARLRAVDGSFISPALPPGQPSFLVSSGGMTPAYASPEQRAGKPLSRKTDIWSWGVSVLDMLMGGVSCPYGGHIADEVLKSLVDEAAINGNVFHISQSIICLLERCFSRIPDKRISTAIELVDILASEYRGSTGRDYPRSMPESNSELPSVVSVSLLTSSLWTDPKIILEAVLNATRKKSIFNFFKASTSTKGDPDTNRTAASDMILLEKAQCELEQAVVGGRKELQIYLADVYIQNSSIHRHLGDVEGALILSDKAIELSHMAIRSFNNWEYYRQVISAIESKVRILYTFGRLDESVEPCNQLVSVLKMLVFDSHRYEYAYTAAINFCNIGMIDLMRKDYRSADLGYKAAISILESLAVNKHNSAESIQKALAGAYNLKALVCSRTSDIRTAILHFNKSIAVLEELGSRSGAPEDASSLMTSYMNKAICLVTIHQHHESILLCDKAISLARNLKGFRSSTGLMNKIAGAISVKASSMVSLKQYLAAVDLYDEAINIRQQIVSVHGSEHMKESLYRLLYYRDIALGKAGNSIINNYSNS